MSRFSVIILAIGIALAVLSAFAVRNGYAGKAILMDRGSGDMREGYQIVGFVLWRRDIDPLWIAEYAGDRRGDWKMIHTDSGRSGPRVHYAWGGIPAAVHHLGMSLDLMNASDEMRRAAGEEVLELLGSREPYGLILGALQSIAETLWDRVDRGDVLTSDEVGSIFKRAMAELRIQWQP